MGYWIIVILIVLGGILVLLAAASVGADDEKRAPQDPPARFSDSSALQPQRAPKSSLPVHVTLYISRSWTQDPSLEFMPGLTGVSSFVELIESMTLAELAAGIESSPRSLGDSVVIIVAGADDYLAGQPLDSVLDQLDHVLDRLSNLPAMAVVGSLPNVEPAIEDYVPGIATATVSTTIAVWNQAIADVANAYSAEFVDLSAVPVELIERDGDIADQRVTVCPNLSNLAIALEPAICRAVERIRSFQSNS